MSLDFYSISAAKIIGAITPPIPSPIEKKTARLWLLISEGKISDTTQCAMLAPGDAITKIRVSKHINDTRGSVFV